MKALEPITARLASLGQRLDQLSLRERGLVFAAGVVLVYIAWQTLLMTPMTNRERAAEQRLDETRRQLTAIEQVGAAAAADPVVSAAVRNRALKEQLKILDAQLDHAAQGYVAPEHMTDLLREILAQQHGLTLVSLKNLPVESLSNVHAPGQAAVAPGPSAQSPVPRPRPTGDDRGPFLHPVEIVVDGDFASLVGYLRAIEGLPWQIQWQRLELNTREHPINRVHIVIGALSLSRDWLSV